MEKLKHVVAEIFVVRQQKCIQKAHIITEKHRSKFELALSLKLVWS